MGREMKKTSRTILQICMGLAMAFYLGGCAIDAAPKAKKVSTAAACKICKAAAKHAKAVQKNAIQKEMCGHSIAVKKYIKGSKNKKKSRKLGTAGDMEMRALAIAGLAKKLKYGSVTYYAQGLEEASQTGKKSEVKKAYKLVGGAVNSSLKLDKSKAFGKCSCSKIFNNYIPEPVGFES